MVFNLINNMTKKILIIFMIISINACGLIVQPMPKSWDWGLKPRPLTGVRGFPETDTDYGKGFKAGCENAWQASSKGWTDVLPQTINPTLMSSNPDWAQGWWDAYEHCTYIMDWDVV
jgi:hypothetical protein